MIAMILGIALALAFASEAAASGLEVPADQVISAQQADQQSADLMLDEPVGDLPVVDDARWSAGVTDNSLIATIWWICLLVLLFFAGLPWARIPFREALSSAGHARLIALLISGYLIWIMASLELIRFRAIWTALVLALVGVVGWAFLWTRRNTGSSEYSLRSSIFGPEIAFWSVFAVSLVFRLINPDSWHPIWGGEKPMELAHVNAILRSAHFPPYDPWFSGGILNYYYYGEFLVAYLMKLGGIPSEIAFNLAQPTFMALLASGVYSVSASLAGRIASRSANSWIGGAAGVVIVVAMGNLVAFQKVIENLPSLPSPSFIDWTWAASRAIAGGITEFPYFTGLYADLHAHVVALPVTVLIIALGFEVASRTTDASFRVESKTLIVPALLLALSLGTLGASNAWDVPLYATLIAASVFMGFQQRHSPVTVIAWSLASAGIVFGVAYLLFKPFHDSFVALFSSVDRVRSGAELTEFIDHLGGLLALIALGLAAWLIDRHWRSASIDGKSRLPLIVISAGAIISIVAAALELNIVSRSTAEFLTVSILAIVAVAAFTLARFGSGAYVLLATATIAAAVLVVAWRGWPVLALALALAAIGALIWMSDSRVAVRFTGLLIAAGGFAAGGVELVYVVDDLQSLEDWYRMNTLFKIYNEVWITLGLAASALIGALAISLNADQSQEPHGQENDQSPIGATRPVIAAAAAAVIAAGLLYPLLATMPRLDLRFPGHEGRLTLNALDWMNYGTIESAAGDTIAFDEDLDVINWFNAEVAGSPVIAEASIGPYRGNGSRISIATGLPAVLGWDRHERQQRYAPEIAIRNADLDELYNAADPERKLEILDRYGVQYVIVGEVERKTIVQNPNPRPYASPEGLAAFESMVGTSLEIAFQSGETVVYRVISAAG